jgi:hypothetical protein
MTLTKGEKTMTTSQEVEHEELQVAREFVSQVYTQVKERKGDIPFIGPGFCKTSRIYEKRDIGEAGRTRKNDHLPCLLG